MTKLPKIQDTQSTAASGTETLARRFAYASALMAVLALGYAYWSDREYSKSTRTLRSSEANVLLLVQQVDALSRQYLKPMSPSGELASEEQDSLETWLRFDSQFVDANRADAQMRFEVGAALTRIGIAHMLLNDYAASHLALVEAGEHFCKLQEQYPENFLYRNEESATWMHLANLNAQSGKLNEARANCRRAFDVLGIELGPFSNEHDEFLATVLGDLLKLATVLQAQELVGPIAAARLEALERMAPEYVNDAEFQQLLEDTRQQLQLIQGNT